MSGMNKQLLQDLMQNIEARKQTEQRLKATMGVLLARSENQILVLETLLKRLVQVCVHTQDKRLAKELKLMDFTRLAKKIGDEHTHMRQMLIHEDGMLGPSPAESFLMDPLNSAANTAMNMQNGAPRLEDSQLSAGANAVNLSQYRSSSQSAATQHAVLQQQMLQQQKAGTGPPGQHMAHLQPSQAPPLSQSGGPAGGALRRDSSGAPLNQNRDPSLQLRNLWSQDGGSLDGSGLSGMPGGVPGMQALAGQTNPLLMGGRGGGGGMHMPNMMRSTSAAGSGLNNAAPSVSGGPLRGYNDNEQPFGNFP